MGWIDVLPYVLVGFSAQMIDGALGMAYGVSATTFMTALGMPAAVTSASVHVAETFTTLVSGASHCMQQNIDWRLFRRLVIPGMVGGVAGAYFVANMPLYLIKPGVILYLFIMGTRILYKALRNTESNRLNGRKIIPIGLAGGFFDAIGGGGWGPIVTSTFIASGNSPRYVIGTVNTAEFFVTLIQVLSFSFLLDISRYFYIVLGLSIGGVIAAPLAALLCKKIPVKPLTIVVGVLLLLTNTINLVQWLR